MLPAKSRSRVGGELGFKFGDHTDQERHPRGRVDRSPSRIEVRKETHEKNKGKEVKSRGSPHLRDTVRNRDKRSPVPMVK